MTIDTDFNFVILSGGPEIRPILAVECQFQAQYCCRCGRILDNVGFDATVVANCICMGAENRVEAYSVAEALRKGAAEGEVEDLHVQALCRAGKERPVD